MSIAELLLDTAAADHDLLDKNRQRGDRAAVPRDLEFVFHAKNRARADLVACFVADNHYGRGLVEQVEGKDGAPSWRLIVAINAPATDHVVCSLSGLMACLSKIYDLEYDGWGCVLQR